jgi:peptide-methionine (S)-S-oxide reductase
MKKLICSILFSIIAAYSAFAAPEGPKLDTATFATGCFWCTQATFQELRGVIKVTAGFTGGHTANPSYQEVCTGTTGHAEACNIVFDPHVISFDTLLEVFMTLLN